MTNSSTTPQELTAASSPRLLVSVKDCYEANLALSSGVDWIDLKSPASGSLGAPTPEIAEQVAETLRQFQNRSVALGELHDVESLNAERICAAYPIAKVGMSGCRRLGGWQAAFVRLSGRLASSRLIPVVYADWRRCDAPSPADVLELAGAVSSPYLLFDTFIKDGRSLPDFFSREQLLELCRRADAHQIRVVAAGSLREADLCKLHGLPISVIAVRGAVCCHGRDSQLSPQRLRQWVGRMARHASATAQ
jgi:(5-formylfuran-3-yl)methyl phosphate synthase